MLDALSSLVAVASTGLQQLGNAAASMVTASDSTPAASGGEASRKSSQLPRYTLQDVCQHCHHNDCWIVIHNRVYDVTNFLNKHPGGEEILWEHAGRDATLAFTGTGHTLEAVSLLQQYCIGILVEEEQLSLFNDLSLQMAVTAQS
uniref:Putative cytochrome b5 ixodes scapularis cytochrome b5 n=1 Tax=Amblyomma triste TaxID=251400 RepID=A0A023GCB0_AMBTT